MAEEEPVELGYEAIGEGEPALLLHGLLGSGRNLRGVGQALAGARRVHLIDLRNHGASPWAAPMDYRAMAADLLAHMDRLGLERAALLGHSMGGKAAMRLAGLAPERVSELVVVDIAPTPRSEAPFAAYVEAMRAADLSVGRRGAIEAQLADAVPDPRVRSFLLTNLERGEAGFRWRCNLDRLARDMEAITDFSHSDAEPYRGPTRFVIGERSDYVRPEDDAVIERWFPRADRAVVGGAGHWPHADAPEAFLDALPEGWRG